MAGVLAKAPISSPFFGSKEDSLCVLMDLHGGFALMGQILLKKQHKAIAGQALTQTLKYLPVLIAFAFFLSYFSHQSIK